MSGIELSTFCQMSAVFGSGIVAGFLSGVTFLSTRTFESLVAKKEAETIKKLFPIWWPFGKSFMVPALLFNLLTHITTYYVTGNKLWILTGCTIFSIGPYTAFVMNEDIETLRGNKNGANENNDEDVFKFTKSFCKSHHLRLFLALIAYCTSLYLMALK